MSTAASPMGLKRICMNCGERFYDLNKRPITCPACQTEFTGEVKPKRRGRGAADPIKEEVKKVEAEAETEEVQKEENDIVDEDPEVEVVSLDDAEVAETDDEDAPILDDEDTLDDIPELDADIDEELGSDMDDEALLDDED